MPKELERAMLIEKYRQKFGEAPPTPPTWGYEDLERSLLIERYRKKFGVGPPIWGYDDSVAKWLMAEAIHSGKPMVGVEEYYDLPSDPGIWLEAKQNKKSKAE